MKLICPYCNSKFSVEESQRTKTLVNLIQALQGFDKHCPLVWEYTGAFATQRLGPIAPAKRLRIVTELGRLWENGVFEVDKKQYRITRDVIIKGMKIVCDLEKFGFKNHNYLKKILQSDAERISAEGLTAREEREREEDRNVRRKVGQAFQPAETLSPEQQRALKKRLGISKFSELIGKNIKKSSKVQDSGVEGLKNGTTETKRPQDGAGSAGV